MASGLRHSALRLTRILCHRRIDGIGAASRLPLNKQGVLPTDVPPNMRWMVLVVQALTHTPSQNPCTPIQVRGPREHTKPQSVPLIYSPSSLFFPISHLVVVVPGDSARGQIKSIWTTCPNMLFSALSLYQRGNRSAPNSALEGNCSPQQSHTVSPDCRNIYIQLLATLTSSLTNLT